MRVLVACEFSGVVREAFRLRGHDAWSCDLLPSEQDGPHYRGDVFHALDGIAEAAIVEQRLGNYRQIPRQWDLLIFFWPCTNMASSGARWFEQKREAQERDIAIFKTLMDWPGIPRIAGENPIGVLSTRYRKPDQIIQPWMFGHPETKATCLWLKGLPPLVPTNIVEGRTPRVHYESPGPDRWKRRSRTLPGIAEAMASQWGATSEGKG